MQEAYIIGDVHGCYAELEKLLALTKPGARIIFVGDLVDRGPHPRECLEAGERHEAVFGNHEEGTLRRRTQDREKLAPHHRHTQESLEERHFEYMARMPNYLALSEYNAVVVHAGLIPHVPLSAQKQHFLLHGQHLRRPERRWAATEDTWRPSKAPEDALFWADAYEAEAASCMNGGHEPWPLVLYGHTVFERPYVQQYSIGLDTGCCFGGQLTAVELPSRRLIQVPAERAYHESRRNLVRLASGIHCFS